MILRISYLFYLLFFYNNFLYAIESDSIPWMDLVGKIINFSILLGILIFFGKKPILTFLRSQAKKKKEDLDKVTQQLQEEEKKLASCKNELALLQEEILVTKKEAMLASERQKEEMIREANLKAEKIYLESKQQIQLQFEQAQQKIKETLATETIKLTKEHLIQNPDALNQTTLFNKYTQILNEGR